MKIGIDVNCFSDPHRTGIGRYTENVVRQFLLHHSGHSYVLYSAMPVIEPFRSELLEKPNVVLQEAHFPSRYAWQQMFLSRRIRRDKPDVFLSVDGLLPPCCPVPAVTVVHDLIWRHYPGSTAPHIRWVYRLRLKSSVRKARRCIADSRATLDDLVRYTGISPDKARVVYAAVEERFAVQPPDRSMQVIRNLSLEQPYLFFIGNLMFHKNLHALLKAYRKCLDRAGAITDTFPHLVIAGCRNWKSSDIVTLVRTLELESHVHFLGYVSDEDLPALYSGAEFFIFPSLIEGFGLPVLEAQSCGTPVICSNTYSLPEVGGDSALYFDPSSVADMADAMWRAHNDPDLRRALTQKGYENIKRFSWSRTAREIMDVLETTARNS